MTPEQIAAVRERLAAATPGPWITFKTNDDDGLSWILMPAAMRKRPTWNEIGYVNDDYPAEADLLANTPTDIAALLAEVGRLNAALARVRELHRTYAHPAGAVMCQHCWDAGADDASFPCPTIRAIDGAS